MVLCLQFLCNSQAIHKQFLQRGVSLTRARSVYTACMEKTTICISAMVLAMNAFAVDTVSTSLQFLSNFSELLFTALYARADQVVHRDNLVEVQQMAYELSGGLRHLLNVSRFFLGSNFSAISKQFPTRSSFRLRFRPRLRSPRLMLRRQSPRRSPRRSLLLCSVVPALFVACPTSATLQLSRLLRLQLLRLR